MKKILMIAVVLFTACSSGPQVVNEYQADKSKRTISLKKNRLGGSYWEDGEPHTLDLNFELNKYDLGNNKFQLTLVYYAKGRAFEEDKFFLNVKVDNKIFKIDDLFYYDASERVTKNRWTGDVVERSGNFFEFAVFDIDQELVDSIANSTSVQVTAIGVCPNSDWYFNELNFQKFREFYNLCRNYL